MKYLPILHALAVRPVAEPPIDAFESRADATKSTLCGTLETQAMNSIDRKVVHVAPTRFETPNWLAGSRTNVCKACGSRT
jgi:hypothetical protein